MLLFFRKEDLSIFFASNLCPATQPFYVSFILFALIRIALLGRTRLYLRASIGGLFVFDLMEIVIGIGVFALIGGYVALCDLI